MIDLAARLGWTRPISRTLAITALIAGVLIALTDDPWRAGLVLVLGAVVLLTPTLVVILGAVERCAGRAEQDHPYRVERCPDCEEVVDVRLRTVTSDPVRAAERLLEHRLRRHPGRVRRRS